MASTNPLAWGTNRAIIIIPVDGDALILIVDIDGSIH